MAAPSSNKKAKLAATPDKPPAPTGKMIASAQARTTDWYVGIDWREEQGFDRNNPHRLALNDLMRPLMQAGSVVLVSAKGTPDLHKYYKFGYGNMRDTWERTLEPASWLEQIQSYIATNGAAHIDRWEFRIFENDTGIPRSVNTAAELIAAVRQTARPATPDAEPSVDTALVARVTALEARVQALEPQPQQFGNWYGLPLTSSALFTPSSPPFTPPRSRSSTPPHPPTRWMSARDDTTPCTASSTTFVNTTINERCISCACSPRWGQTRTK